MKCAIFDLDGTLVNTIDDLTRAVDYVLNEYGKEKKWSIADYTSFVGNGAKKLIECSFENSLTDNQLDDAYAMFKNKYNQILIDNAYVYDGIKDALNQLKQQGIKLAVVTNKPHESAVKMLDKLFGESYFDVVVGAKDGVPKKPNPVTTLVALAKLNCTADQAMFFGDSDVDIKTAKNAGVEAVGCSWGFRSFECLFAAGPSVIIDEPKYIIKLF